MSYERREKRRQANKRYQVLSAIARVEGRQFHTNAGWAGYLRELVDRGVIVVGTEIRPGRGGSVKVNLRHVHSVIDIKEAKEIMEGAMS